MNVLPTKARLAFVDCETTALSPDDGRIWELGAIMRGPEHNVNLPLHAHVDDVKLEQFDPGAAKVGRFSERYKRDAASMPEKMMAYAVHSNFAGRYLVGANVAFDQAFLTDLLRRHDLRPSWHYRVIDVEVLAAGAFAWPTPMGLRQTAEFMDVSFDPDELHTAYGDAELAMKIYDQLIHGQLPTNGKRY